MLGGRCHLVVKARITALWDSGIRAGQSQSRHLTAKASSEGNELNPGGLPGGSVGSHRIKGLHAIKPPPAPILTCSLLSWRCSGLPSGYVLGDHF